MAQSPAQRPGQDETKSTGVVQAEIPEGMMEESGPGDDTEETGSMADDGKRLEQMQMEREVGKGLLPMQRTRNLPCSGCGFVNERDEGRESIHSVYMSACPILVLAALVRACATWGFPDPRYAARLQGGYLKAGTQQRRLWLHVVRQTGNGRNDVEEEQGTNKSVSAIEFPISMLTSPVPVPSSPSASVCPRPACSEPDLKPSRHRKALGLRQWRRQWPSAHCESAIQWVLGASTAGMEGSQVGYRGGRRWGGSAEPDGVQALSPFKGCIHRPASQRGAEEVARRDVEKLMDVPCQWAAARKVSLIQATRDAARV
ncbi:hypothetical protein CCMA1212_007675 [Trichoderma ghanense]|uniref:Uncharacterized protein n=1 Tax=Trichoderma ghanense TaxID=65468 RepID=A0ABY2GWZ5_9HYPO